MEWTDLLLAIAHHLAIFALAAVLAAEFALIRPGLAGETVRRVGNLDRAYGALAGLIIVIGFARVFLGIKGWEFYIQNWVFWAKLAAFGVVGLLSIPPTLRIFAWTAAAKRDPGYAVSAGEITAIRRYLKAEAAVFVLIPISAAAMARGFGY
jgi:putative membrane protein